MKKILCLAVGLPALGLSPVIAQQQSTPSAANYQQRLQAIVENANPPEKQPSHLTKFNLNFSGGTPAELVKAIEKATGKPLNAIIPTEDAEIQLPPLKMNDVVIPQLFAALKAASLKTVAVQNQMMYGGGFAQVNTGYGFETSDNPVTDTSIWYFHATKPNLPPVVSTDKVCRFYPLALYLNRGFSVDDITTAIQTGWKMAGLTSPPELEYHKETKLLIAFGEPDQLKTIESVLSSLPESNVTQTQIDKVQAEVGSLRTFTQHHLTQLDDKITELTKVVSKLDSNPQSSSKENSGK